MMRVLYDAMQSNNRSGTGRYTVELLRALASLDTPAELTAVAPAHAPLGDLPANVTLVQRAEGVLARVAANQWAMPRLARGGRHDLVHYPANIGAPRNRIPAVLTVHDLSFLHHPEWFRRDRALYYRWAVARSAQAATRLLAVSQFTADDLHEWLGVPLNRIDVAHNGVGSEFVPASEAARDHVRRKYDLPDRFFLFVGTIEPRKNLPRLVEAWSRIAGHSNTDLVVAGRLGWKTAPVQESVRLSAHRARIHLPGFVAPEDLPALLSAARVFVWPSLFEGFGLPPLEAMACGTPVITSDSTAMAEIAGPAAETVHPEDTDAIADAMIRLDSDDALRERRRREGLVRASAFTWIACARNTRRAYEQALA